MIKEMRGNIFTTQCQTIVNTINCVGVMGAGIAFEFRLRYPDMFKKYKELCDNHIIEIGKLWIYKTENKWILNFPTKYTWKEDSKIEYLEKGLKKFVESYQEKGVTSIAFPMLGASMGGIPESESLKVMRYYLNMCDIDVEIYSYDPKATDDVYEKFKVLFNSLTEKELSSESGLRIYFIRRIKENIENPNVRNMSGLLRCRGIGEVSLEKCFRFVNDYKGEQTSFEFASEQ